MRQDRSANEKQTGSERGATTVEFAVIAALLFVILFGIIEYALLFLQEHYVANAAREAVRIGVRANNYSYYNGAILPTAAAGMTVYDRETVVRNMVADYLGALYDEGAARAGTSLVMEDPDCDLSGTDKDRVLVVTVEIEPLFTNIAPRLVGLLGAGDGPAPRGTIRYAASMELEEQKEFDTAKAKKVGGRCIY